MTTSHTSCLSSQTPGDLDCECDRRFSPGQIVASIFGSHLTHYRVDSYDMGTDLLNVTEIGTGARWRSLDMNFFLVTA